jgi:hypothetical protein
MGLTHLLFQNPLLFAAVAVALLWFLLNDRIKLVAYRIFDPNKSRTQPVLAPLIVKQA